MHNNFSLAFFLVLIAIYGCSHASKRISKISYPFEKTLVKDTLIEIDPTKSQVLRFENSLTIDIPKDAFANKNGKTIQDKVQLSIKTYGSPAKFIASGIPMQLQYGEAYLQSAGLLELKGQSKGKPNLYKEGRISHF